MEEEQTDVVLSTGLGTKNHTKSFKIKFEFTCFDYILFGLIIAGIVMSGTCYNATQRGQCAGIDEIGEAGLFMVIGGLVPYVITFILSIFNILNTK